MWRTSQPKFCPKKPVMKVSGRKMVAMHRQLLHDAVQPVRDRREVDVHRPGEQIAVAVDQIADPDQMVVDVAEVALVLIARTRAAPRSAPIRRANVSRCGLTALRIPTSSRFILKISCSCSSSASSEDRVLELVDAIVERRPGSGRSCPPGRRRPGRAATRAGRSACRALIAAPDLGEGGTVIVVDGDEEALGVEAVHLDQPVVVRRRAVHDEEDEVVVVIELGPLAELLRVLDRERMEPEDVAQDLEVGSCPAGRGRARRTARRPAAPRPSRGRSAPAPCPRDGQHDTPRVRCNPCPPLRPPTPPRRPSLRRVPSSLHRASPRWYRATSRGRRGADAAARGWVWTVPAPSREAV